MEELKTNYVDDVLDSSKNQLRKYQQIQNDDGTVSFVDVTEYSTTGTSFGAKDINDTNTEVNELNNSLVRNTKTYENINIIAGSVNITITKQKCYRKGNLVHIEFMAKSTVNSATGYVWAVIPSAYRPQSDFTSGICTISGGIASSCAVLVKTNGYVYQQLSANVSANSVVTFYTEYHIDVE